MDALLHFLEELVDWAVDEFPGWSQRSSIRFLSPKKTLHTLHTYSQTVKHQMDTREEFISKTLHTTLHKPYTLCFAKLVDITGSLWVGI